jgi:putative peptidoglycan lipid II flippase
LKNLVTKNSLAKHSLISAMAIMASRILGFIRDLITANLFGATVEYDMFILFFRIPNLMRKLFAEGAFSQAFIPIFAEYTQNKDQQQTRLFVSKITGNLTSVLFTITLLGVICAPYLIKIFAPGWFGAESIKGVMDLNKFNHAIYMLRVIFPYIFFISLAALAAGILNCNQQFFIPALTPIWLNLSLIGFTLFLSKKIHPPEFSLAWGVLVGGFLQLLFQIPFVYKLKMLPRITIDWHDPVIKKILLLMLPATLGAAVSQINILIDSFFVSFLKSGSVTWLYYADRLMELPLGVFGMSFATVMLPQLSRSFAKANYLQFNQTLYWGVKCALLVGIPSTLLMFFLSGPIISTLFLTGKFNNYDVIMTSNSLKGYALSIIGIMLTKIFYSGFYAVADFKTPAKVGCVLLIINIICNFLLIKPLQHVGIALSNSIISIIHAGILFYLLFKKKFIRLPESYIFGIPLVFAALFLAVFLFFYLDPNEKWLLWQTKHKVLKLTEVVLLSIGVYFSILRIFGFKLKNLLFSGGC